MKRAILFLSFLCGLAFGAGGGVIGSPSAILQESAVTLTSAQIKSLAANHANAIEILPAPGAGKAVVVRYIVTTLNFATTPYTWPDTGGLTVYPTSVGLGDTGGWDLAASVGLVVSSQTETRYFELAYSGGAQTAENTGISVTNTTASGITVGDSTLTIRLYYQLVTL